MAVLTIQATGTEDAQIHPSLPDNNWANYHPVGCESGVRRICNRFDFTSLPAGAVISNATVSWKFYATISGDPVGVNFSLCELTQTAWTEGGVTWRKYDGANLWSAAGGDYTLSGAVTVVCPAAGARPVWFDWNMTSMIQHFQSAHGKIANMIMIASGGTPSFGIDWYSSEAGGVTDRPKLVITYDIPPPPASGAYTYLF